MNMKSNLILFSCIFTTLATSHALALTDPPNNIICRMNDQKQLECSGMNDQFFNVYEYNVEMKPGEKAQFEFNSAIAFYEQHGSNNFMILVYANLFECVKFRSKSSVVVPLITQGDWQQNSPHYYRCDNSPNRSHCPFTIESTFAIV